MGLLLRGIKKEQIHRGMVISAPGTMKSVKKLQAQIYVSGITGYLLYVTNVDFHQDLNKG